MNEEMLTSRVCRKCGHRWLPRTPAEPRQCPNRTCHTFTWNRDRRTPVAPVPAQEVQA